MADLIAYQVQEGETWFNVSYKMYGTETLTAPIIAANPQVPITNRLPGGLVLYVPVLSANDNTQISAEQLPPWT